MARVTQPLREEHQTLLPHVEQLRSVADRVGETTLSELRAALDQARGFLTGTLIPHASAEEQVLYPEVERLLGARGATETMSWDHRAIHHLIQELESLGAQIGDGALGSGEAMELRRVLYGLYTLVRVHFEKEEEIYLPLLDQRLSTSEATELFRRMEEAAAKARGGGAS